MSILNVSLIQSDIIWEKPSANHSHLDQLLNNIPSKTELVILPEMFNTGFSMNASDLAEEMNGPTIKWMKLQARKHQAVIAGSLMIHENGNFYNRFIWATPSGAMEHSDKRLYKKYQNLREDIEVVKQVLEVLPDARPPFSYEINNLGMERCIIKVKKMACKSLGVCPKIIMIELYHKNEKATEDRDRIKKHFT